MSKKKKILYQSNFALVKTGFGRASRAILSYLYKTGKYDIVQYCTGTIEGDHNLNRTPWKSVGCLPANPAEQQRLNQDQEVLRRANYGDYYLDKVIKEEKPDVYFAVEDIWGVDFATNREWWNKFPCVIHTTLDSLPILDGAIQLAPKIENYWVWSKFAETALHKLGHNHVKTVHGAIDTSNFYRLSDKKRQELRVKMNLPLDAFIIGFVFRNQLRKSVPNLLKGYRHWKLNNPDIKNTFLLLHTHFTEAPGQSWDIMKLAKQYEVNPSEILCTYICKNCKAIEVKNYTGQDKDCRFCGAKGAPPSQELPQGSGQITANPQIGASEEQLNEVYNLMDCYIHPFTSGGQEVPIQEAKLTELVTLVTNYSCGEEMCESDAHSLPLEYDEYTEIQTHFLKSNTRFESIAKQLNKVYHMDPKKRLEMGKKARRWVLNNFSAEAVGKIFEEFIDSLPSNDYDFNFGEEVEKDPDAVIEPLSDDTAWILSLYEKILKIKHPGDGLDYWLNQLKNAVPREKVEAYFRQVGRDENQKIQQKDFENLLGDEDANKRLLFVMPKSIGDIFLCTSLFKSIKELYPEHIFYFACEPQYKHLLDGNEYVDRVIDYQPFMDNLLQLEGMAKHKGHFDIAFLPHLDTQRLISYTHNGHDVTDIEFKY